MHKKKKSTNFTLCIFIYLNLTRVILLLTEVYVFTFTLLKSSEVRKYALSDKIFLLGKRRQRMLIIKHTILKLRVFSYYVIKLFIS